MNEVAGVWLLFLNSLLLLPRVYSENTVPIDVG